jgi:hypothetical protein
MLISGLTMNFSEKFCASRGLPPEKYEETVMRLALRPLARLLWPLLAFYPNYFAADRDLVRAVGRLSRVRDFEDEAVDFAHNPVNRGFFRQTLQLRVSTRRLLNLVEQTLHDKRAEK